MWHDIGRTHDGVDYYHGAKSAGRVMGIGLHLDRCDDRWFVETTLFAVTHHSGCGARQAELAIRYSLRAARVRRAVDGA